MSAGLPNGADGAKRRLLHLTFDLEDPTGVYAPDGRYVAMAQRLLDFCDEMGRRATFFTVGQVAQNAPYLIKQIAARGHEIAYHSLRHLPLDREQPFLFQKACRDDKERLEQLAGSAVVGFRAPCYSLTRETYWAIEALADAGFLYSSSIMPTSISRYGHKAAPRTPFRWPAGMVEFPLPVFQWKKLRIPYLGGIYLYAAPFALARAGLAHADEKEVLWTYAHPYDFDRTEPFALMPNTPAWVSLILRAARLRAEAQMRRVLAATAPAPTLATRLQDDAALQQAPFFNPFFDP